QLDMADRDHVEAIGRVAAVEYELVLFDIDLMTGLRHQCELIGVEIAKQGLVRKQGTQIGFRSHVVTAIARSERGDANAPASPCRASRSSPRRLRDTPARHNSALRGGQVLAPDQGVPPP